MTLHDPQLLPLSLPSPLPSFFPRITSYANTTHHDCTVTSSWLWEEEMLRIFVLIIIICVLDAALCLGDRSLFTV